MSETSFPTDARPVLVAHDLGAGGRRAADLGAVFARALGVRLHLVHAMDAAADAEALARGLTDGRGGASRAGAPPPPPLISDSRFAAVFAFAASAAARFFASSAAAAAFAAAAFLCAA